MATIHLIGGEKGGVGKSWIARAMVQYFLDGGQADREVHPDAKAIPFVAIECDRSNPTLSNIYGQYTKQVVLSENPETEDLVDPIFELAIQIPVIVNLPAQAHRPLRDWIRNKSLIKAGEKYNVNFIHWFVSDGEDDSLNLLIESLKELAPIPHVFVKNLGRCDEWQYFEQHAPVQAAIAQHHVKVVDFPKLSTLKRIPINAQRLTFAQAREHQEFGILGRNQIVLYLESVYQAFESTQYLPQWQLIEPKPMTPPTLVENSSVAAPTVLPPVAAPVSVTKSGSRRKAAPADTAATTEEPKSSSRKKAEAAPSST